MDIAETQLLTDLRAGEFIVPDESDPISIRLGVVAASGSATVKTSKFESSYFGVAKRTIGDRQQVLEQGAIKVEVTVPYFAKGDGGGLCRPLTPGAFWFYSAAAVSSQVERILAACTDATKLFIGERFMWQISIRIECISLSYKHSVLDLALLCALGCLMAQELPGLVWDADRRWWRELSCDLESPAAPTLAAKVTTPTISGSPVFRRIAGRELVTRFPVAVSVDAVTVSDQRRLGPRDEAERADTYTAKAEAVAIEAGSGSRKPHVCTIIYTADSLAELQAGKYLVDYLSVPQLSAAEKGVEVFESVNSAREITISIAVARLTELLKSETG